MHIYIRQTADGLYPASGGFKAHLALGLAMSRRGHAVKMEVRCSLEQAREAAEGEGSSLQTGRQNLGGRSVPLYRFKWMGLHVLGVDETEHGLAVRGCRDLLSSWLSVSSCPTLNSPLPLNPPSCRM